MAVTGPFSRNVYTPSTGPGAIGFSFSKRQLWYRQTKPYRTRLPYECDIRYCEMRDNYVFSPNPGGIVSGAHVASATIENDPYFTQTVNKTYAKFKDLVVGEAAQSAVNIAERKQAIDAMSKRLFQMVRFTRALKSFNFPQAARELGFRVIKKTDSRAATKMVLRYTSKRRIPIARSRRYVKYYHQPKAGDYEVTLKRGVKGFADNYLEFHFGWEPLVQDIGTTMEIIHDPVVLGVGGRHTVRASSTTYGPNAVRPSLANGETGHSYKWISKVQMIADVSVADANEYNLNRLGFVNPAVVLWELVPFSFLVDWFVNVGQVLSSYTDFLGLALSNAATTRLVEMDDNRYQNLSYIPGRGYHWEIKYHKWMRRSQGIAGPKFALREIKLPSVTRGLTASSLLAQLLK